MRFARISFSGFLLTIGLTIQVISISAQINSIADECVIEAGKLSTHSDTAISKCDAALKEARSDSDKANLHFFRGFARYTKIRNKRSPQEQDTFAQMLANASLYKNDALFARQDFEDAMELAPYNNHFLAAYRWVAELLAIINLSTKPDKNKTGSNFFFKEYLDGSLVYWDLAGLVEKDKAGIATDIAVYNSLSKMEPVKPEEKLEYIMSECIGEGHRAVVWCNIGLNLNKADPTMQIVFNFHLGMARYHIIRGNRDELSGIGDPLSATLAKATKFKEAEISEALDPLITLIGPAEKMFGKEKVKRERVAIGALYAISAVTNINDRAKLRQNALDEWNKAEQAGADKKILDDDRAALDNALKNTAATAGHDSVEARVKNILTEFGPLEIVYEKNAAAFYDILKQQTTSASPNNKAVCQAMIPLAESWKNVIPNFQKLVAMKNKGELAGFPALIKNIESRQAQEIDLEKNFRNAVVKFGCN